MLTALLVLLAAAALALIAREIRLHRREATAAQLLALFAPAAAAADDARALLAWQPVADAARRLFPDTFAALDRAAGGRFPFDARHVQTAHARWTAEWLAWEGAHDQEWKLRTAAAEEDLARRHARDTPAGRTQLAALEQGKLQQYQQRYEEYVRVSKALAAIEPPGAGPEGAVRR